MNRRYTLCLAVLASFSACSTTSDRPARAADMAVETVDPAAAVDLQGSEGGAVDASMSRGQAPEAAQAQAGKLPAAVFAFWREPEFQRRFTDSYQRESDIEPPMTSSEVELLQEVMGLMADEEFDNALSRLRGRQSDGASATIDFTLGSLYFQREKFAEAEKEYEIAVRKERRFRRAWKNLGLVRMRLEKYPAAVDAFVRVLELGGGDGLMFGLLAFAHSNAGDHIAAESAYRMAAMMEPSRMDWRMGLAKTFFKQRRYGEAASLCGVLIDQSPDRADLWMLQANAYVGMNEIKMAAENLELVDRLGKSTFDSLALLGDIYINDGLFDLAAKAYVRAIAKKGDYDRVMRAANQLAARSAYDECKELLQGVESAYGAGLDATARKDILKLRARLAVATGAGDEEIKVLEEIVKLDPRDGDALILLGQYYVRNGEPDKAIFHYQQAAEIESSRADALVRHAQLLASEGKYGLALPLLRSAQQLEPREHIQKFLEDVEKVAGR